MSAARELGNLGNQNALTVDTANLKVGIVSTSPVGELQVGSAITMGSASGIISATAYYGDGANLENVASAGLGTAISSTKTEANNLIYYTNAVLGIGSTTTVVTPASTNVAYTQYTDIDVTENCDLIVADGDDFVPDVLGLSTAGISNMSGAGGRVRAGQFVNNAGSGAPQLPYGAEIPVGYGLTGAGQIYLSGIASITNTTESTSATTGALVISGGVGIAKSLNVTGNVTVGGTLTYEDVTNIDSVGIVTGRIGFYAGTTQGSGTGIGATILNTGNAVFAGIVTASSFSGATNEWVLGADGTSNYTFTGPGLTGAENDPSIYVTRGEKYNFKNSSGGHPFRIQSTPNGSTGTQYNDGITNNDAGDGTTLIWDVQFDSPSLLYYQCTAHANMGGKIYVGNSGSGTLLEGTLVEGMTSTTTAYSSSSDLNISNSNFHFSSANLAGTNNTLNIMSNTGINTDMADNQVMNVTALTAVNASTAFVDKISIDGKGVGITTHWVGGSVPTDGGGSGVDTYSFNIMKTGDETFIVIANQVKTS